MKTSKHLLTSFVFAFFQIGLSLGNNMEECVVHEMCGTANGIARTAYCFKLSSQKDIDIYLELSRHVYPNATTIEDVIASKCEDMKIGKEAFYYYYYEKEKMNIVYTHEESMKIVDCRACLTLMITECQLKKAMGFFSFKG